MKEVNKDYFTIDKCLTYPNLVSNFIILSKKYKSYLMVQKVKTKA